MQRTHRTRGQGPFHHSILVICAAVALQIGCGDTPQTNQNDPFVEPEANEPLPVDTEDSPGLEPAVGQTVYLYATTKAAGPPVAKLYYEFDTVRVDGTHYVALTFSEEFVDNTYGANSSPGYGKEHEFRQLVGSDHAIIGLEDGDGNLMFEVKLDYIMEDDASPSGYRSGGIEDGDGKMLLGSEAVVLDARTSLERNLNERGCVYLEDSPAPGDPDCPDWERRVIYEVWLDRDMFGPAGFGRPVLDHVHASPSRMENTIEVEPGDPPEGCEPMIDGPDCEPPVVD